MDIDQQLASKLGFPTSHYRGVERERRWLSRQVPKELILRVETITDLYVTGTRLRLREARPIGGGAPILRLTKKADVDKHTRLVTSIYLSEEEFGLMAASLQGQRIHKLRHRLRSAPGITLLVDEFQGPLEGLLLAEAEFKSQEQLQAYAMPEFAACEVTDDPRFTGGNLVRDGLPKDWKRLVEQ
jgi:CYTH domain-containing protein